MAISLIGANLRKSSSEAKWKAIADKLKTKHYHLYAGHSAIRNWTYQHPTLNASVELRQVAKSVCVCVCVCARNNEDY